LVNRLLPEAGVVFRFDAWNVLLRVRGGQVKARVEQGRVKTDGLLKMHNSGLELRVAVILHSLIKVIARLQLVAAAGGKCQQQRPTEQRQSVQPILDSQVWHSFEIG